MVTRDDFIKLMGDELTRVEGVFKAKNVSYGKEGDAFHNFRSSALRVFGAGTPENMYTVLLTLIDKHLVALSNGGLDTPEFEERTRDVIVYSLIALGIYNEKGV